MSAQIRPPVYRSGEWEIDLARRELRLRGVPTALGSRAFEVVEILVQSAGELVDKYDLMGRVWPGAAVEENTLQAQISAVRRALGADRELLKTVAGRGYRLLGGWSREETVAAGPDTARPAPLFLTNFPTAASGLIGRTADLTEVSKLLSAYRMVTLTGPAGIGKTVLALEVARTLFSGFQGDGLLVELASLAEAGLVPSAVASSLGLKLGGGSISSETVARAIGSSRMLLVLDNCEHLIEAMAELAETLIGKCPHLSILATSREVLRIDGECVYRVPPLDVPPEYPGEVGDVLAHSAAQLLLARVRAQEQDFSPHGEQLRAIAAICRRLDGIPLAIEFAAARAATLGLEQVANRLDDRFAVLTGGRRTALPRHQTLRATLDWSYDLLPDAERRLLRRLSVFAGGFTLDAATAIMDDVDTSAVTMEGIANIVAKSLLVLDRSASPTRWRLLETIRAYALEKLAESGEIEATARRHAEFFRDLLSTNVRGKLTAEDLARHLREIDNVRAALDWSFAQPGEPVIGVAIAAGYASVWLHLTLMVECRERIRCALASSAARKIKSPARMQLLVALGVALIFTMGPVEPIKLVLAESFELAETLDDVDAQLRTLWSVWALHFNIGECFVAQAVARRFALVAQRAGDQASVSVADRLLANSLQYGGNQNEARQLLERVLASYVAPDDQQHTAQFHYDQRVLARTMLARTLWMQGDLAAANREAQQSLGEARRGHQLSLLYPLGWALFPFSLLSGEFAAAEQSLKMLMDLAARYNTAFWKMLGRCLEARLLTARGDYKAGHAGLSVALAECEHIGWTVCFPEFLGALAEASAGLGHIGSALATIDQAIMRAVDGGECWYLPELHRIRGELLVLDATQGGNSAWAEECFLEALRISQTQGALFWELRAAIGLARLRAAQGDFNRARTILEPVFARFTDGHETSDLRAAASMLKAVRSRLV